MQNRKSRLGDVIKRATNDIIQRRSSKSIGHAPADDTSAKLNFFLKSKLIYFINLIIVLQILLETNLRYTKINLNFRKNILAFPYLSSSFWVTRYIFELMSVSINPVKLIVTVASRHRDGEN